MRTSRRSFGHQYLAPSVASVVIAVLASWIASPSTALADCGPDAPPECMCVYIDVPLEFYPNHFRPGWTTLYPQFTVPTALIPVEHQAGTLELNLPMLFPSPNTFLVAPEVPTPELTILGPPSVETFIIHTQSPIELPIFPTLQLVNHEIPPTTPWTPSGVLEYNATLTVVLPDMSYLLPTVPEPSSLLLLALSAASTLASRRAIR